MSAGWPVSKFSVVASYEKTKHQGNDLPYVGLEDIESNTGEFLGTLLPHSVKSSTFRFTPHHILYGRLRPYLNKVLLPDFEGHCSTEIFPIKVHEGCNRNYLFHWLMWPQTVACIDATSTGARMPRANMKEVLDFPVPLPPLAEQKRIVSILDEAFGAIAKAKENAERNLANAKELFESYLNRVFSEKGEGWEEKTIGDVCDLQNGFAFKSKDAVESSNTQLIRLGNLYQNRLDLERKPVFYPDNFPSDYSRFVLQKGDLIMSLTGTKGKEDYGFVVNVPEHDHVLLMNQRVARFIDVQTQDVTKEYLFFFLRSRYFLQTLYPTANGTRQGNLSSGTIKTLPLPLCSVERQNEIAATLRRLAVSAQQIERISQQKLADLDELKQSILQKAFTGQLTSKSTELQSI